MGYMVGNLVLQRHNFRMNIMGPPQMEILNMVIPILMHCSILIFFPSKRQQKYSTLCLIPAAPAGAKTAFKPMKEMQRNDIEFATVYHRICCCKYMTLTNQTLHSF